MKFNLAKPYKFQIFYHTFYISTFSHQKKQNLPIFLIKGYENFSSQIYTKIY
ncbi:hypothetical protein [Campylobacter concisus]|uniref:hypothetical protein n=1 Tax=Campylobacter concisus TaxID=199 RepID=UPI001652FE8A|nr:hypothetical protein [Campylobacter concisus]